MIIFIFIILGLVVGSFLNVVLFRMRKGEGGIIAGRSHCQDCHRQLAWYDNIPVFSFIFLHGRCRYCQRTLSWQYPLVELASGVLFGLVAVALCKDEASIFAVISALLTASAFAAMLVVFVYDLRYMEVPMSAIWIALGSSIGIRLVALLFGVETTHDVLYYIVAGSVPALFFFSISFFSQEKWMGYGDSFIAGIIGLLLGPLGTFVAVLIAVWSGALVGIALLWRKDTSLKSAIPFGPFLIGGLYSAFILMHFAPSFIDFLRL